MLTKPFNEYALWKGQIQKSSYRNPVHNKINNYDRHSRLSISQQMNTMYARYSAFYWEGVKIRQQIYRDERSVRPLYISNRH